MKPINNYVRVDLVKDENETKSASGLILTASNAGNRFKLTSKGDNCATVTEEMLGCFVEIITAGGKLVNCVKVPGDQFYIVPEANILAIEEK